MLRHRLGGWAGLLALGGLLSACGATQAPSPRATPTPTAKASPSRSAAVSSFQATDLSWINAQQGWALGTTASCSAPTCTAVLATQNGGRRWIALAQLSACLLPVTHGRSGCSTGEQQVSNLVFASAKDGYIYADDGESPLLITTDGGADWTVESGRPTAALEISRGEAVRVSDSHPGCPGPCNFSIDEAPVGSNHWTTIDIPTPANNDSAQLAIAGDDMYALFPGSLAAGAGTQQADLYISQDSGAQWTHQGDPCGISGTVANDAQTMAVAAQGVLAVLCAPRGGGTDFVIVSSTAGASFGGRETVPLPLTTQLAATSATNLVVGSGNAGVSGTYAYRLLYSSNGGATWQTVVDHSAAVTSVEPNFLAFGGSSHGWWLAPANQLWTSTDAGGSWSRSSF